MKPQNIQFGRACCGSPQSWQRGAAERVEELSTWPGVVQTHLREVRKGWGSALGHVKACEYAVSGEQFVLMGSGVGSR